MVGSGVLCCFIGLLVPCSTVSISGIEQATTTAVNESPCVDPAAPRNGSVLVWGDYMLIEYSCDQGLFAIGDIFGSCNPVTRQWSIRRPYCVSTECDSPGPLPNGKLYRSHNGSIITAKCKPGYILKGTRKRYCDGYNWVGSPAICRDQYPASDDKREVGDSVNTTNSKELFLRQLEKDVRNADNTCYRRFSAPPEIENGKPTVEYKYNTYRRQWIAIANYTCNDGYRLKDKYQRYKYCKDYNWVGDQDPACILDIQEDNPCDINNGGCQHICKSYQQGRYFCDCETGFTIASNPWRCDDIDECVIENGGCEQICNNMMGSYFCTCDEGYIASGPSCYDIDECLDATRHTCPGDCLNVPGSFRCNCTIPGFKASTDDQICEDVDECAHKNGGCEDTCVNMHGSYKCRCFKKGYRLSADKHNCEDVDECRKYGKRRCQNGQCINKPGSFHCICDSGYYESKNRKKCMDIDECSENNGGCLQVCINMPGNYTCACTEGFQMDNDGQGNDGQGQQCIDINECLTENGGCAGHCDNTIGSYRCQCPDYLRVLSQDGHNCTFCKADQYYDNNTGHCVQCREFSAIPDYINGTSPEDCRCKNGFEFLAESNSCTDINECSEGNLSCDHICNNTIGSAHCTCYSGYVLSEDGTCLDIDECKDNLTNCSQYCNNTIGSYLCYCENGYTLSADNITCDDVDECYEGLLVCDQTCVDFPGGAACECSSGYLLESDNVTCTDVDECLAGDHVCSDMCINTNGSYECDCSGLGFKLSWDKASCVDINECMEGDNECQDECINTLGSYKCSCKKSGFRLQADNTTCDDIDECTQTIGQQCDHLCINEAGSYRCDCNPGYALASFHTCAPCPRDYYRSVDSPECMACPALSRTSGIAMTSISDCKCITGYKGNLTAGEHCRSL